MSAGALIGPTGDLDLPRLVDLCRTEAPDLVANTREEAMRRAEYMRGRDRGLVVAALMGARVVEWEMAHRWPANGRGGPRGDDRPTLDASNVGDREAWQRIYAVGAQDFEWITTRTEPEQLTQAAVIRGPQQGPPPISVGGAVEWYTPPQYVEAARAVLGSIDCDPASSAVAQVTVQAKTYYTEQDNGLARDWVGNVWLNPPYRSSLIVPFVEKVTAHRGDWVVLTNNGTDTAWGQRLLGACSAVCFTDHRIRFLNEDNEAQGPAMQGQMFTYRGGNVPGFLDRFREFGWVTAC